MTHQNRRDIFDPDEVSVMHCINRTVRRAMLCGCDRLAGMSFEASTELGQVAIEVPCFAIDRTL